MTTDGYNTKISHCGQLSVEEAPEDNDLENRASRDRKKLDGGADRNVVANLDHDSL